MPDIFNKLFLHFLFLVFICYYLSSTQKEFSLNRKGTSEHDPFGCCFHKECRNVQIDPVVIVLNMPAL